MTKNPTILREAIRRAGEIMAGYTEDDCRSFTFDRLVDELYEDMVFDLFKEREKEEKT